MVLEYNTAANLISAPDLFYLFKLLQNGSDRILHTVMKEVLQALLIRNRPPRYSVAEAGQKVSGLEKPRVGGNRAV